MYNGCAGHLTSPFPEVEHRRSGASHDLAPPTATIALSSSASPSRRRPHGSNRHVSVVALGVAIAFALVGGSDLSAFERAWPGELGQELNGKKLFEKETFGGNGRTCQTCHSKRTGTLGLADVQRIIDKADPDDRFLIHDALDDDGVGTTRVQTHATIRYHHPAAAVGLAGG